MHVTGHMMPVSMATVSLQEFMRVIGPLISNPTHMKTLVSCMNVMMSISTLPLEVSITVVNYKLSSIV